ncbi:MAG: hypothetical protein NTY48_05825 [Candidatus Diapherotrites archaeon]|nr:hypothetical protein [Candidatus Diapherotrites archaeon]
MHLIISIHLGDESADSVVSLIRAIRLRDKNTYFLNLSSPRKNNLTAEIVKNLLPRYRKCILEIKKGSGIETRFSTYGKDFIRVLRLLKETVGKTELVQATVIGGRADVCFERINPFLHKGIQRVFGTQFLGGKSYLPLIYGNQYSDRLFKKREEVSIRRAISRATIKQRRLNK